MIKLEPGIKVGRLTLIKYSGCRNGKNPIWECQCSCGQIKEILSHHLKTGNIKSCGCLKQELRQPPKLVCKDCKGVFPKEEFPRNNKNSDTRRRTCKPCTSIRNTKSRKKRNARDKRNALIAYGGNPPNCACCQESNVEFLTIDHIDGGGTQHRKEIGHSSGRIYRWLRDQNWPMGFRVLCMNCNYSIGLFGYCPHKGIPND